MFAKALATATHKLGSKNFLHTFAMAKKCKGPIFLLTVKPKKNGLIREGFFK